MSENKHRAEAGILGLLGLVAAIGVAILLTRKKTVTLPPNPSPTPTPTPTPTQPLTCTNGSYNSLYEPDGSTIVIADSIDVYGGTLPYTYQFTWSDGLVDTVTTPVDERTFPAGGQVSMPTKFTVSDSSSPVQSCSGIFLAKASSLMVMVR
jgi:hypothetical protein